MEPPLRCGRIACTVEKMFVKVMINTVAQLDFLAEILLDISLFLAEIPLS